MPEQLDHLIIDWSAVRTATALGLLSKNSIITRISELDEIKKRICAKIYQLGLAHRPKEVVFALDDTKDGHRNYWRESYMVAWYKKHMKFFEYQGTKYAVIDNCWSVLNEETLELTKVVAKDLPPASRTCIKEADEDGEGGVYSWAGSEYTYVDNNWYRYKDGVKAGRPLKSNKYPVEVGYQSIQVSDDVKKAICPKYKGNRSKNKEWPLKTPRQPLFDELDRWMSEDLAPVFGGIIVKAEMAEADDVAGVLVAGMVGNVGLMTTDVDWAHIPLFSDAKVTVFDGHAFKKMAHFTHTDLLRKQIGGDTGDNVAGTWLKTAVNCKLGNKGEPARRLSEEENPLEKVDTEAAIRNAKLMFLSCDQIPKIIQSNIKDAYTEAKKSIPPVKTWQDAGYYPTEQNSVREYYKNWQEARNLVMRLCPQPDQPWVVVHDNVVASRHATWDLAQDAKNLIHVKNPLHNVTIVEVEK